MDKRLLLMLVSLTISTILITPATAVEDSKNIHKELTGGFFSPNSGWLDKLKPRQVRSEEYRDALIEVEQFLNGSYDAYYKNDEKQLERNKSEARQVLLENINVRDLETAQEVRQLLKLPVKVSKGETQPGPLDFEGKIEILGEMAVNIQNGLDGAFKKTDWYSSADREIYNKQAIEAYEKIEQIKNVSADLIEQKKMLDWRPPSQLVISDEQISEFLDIASDGFDAVLRYVQAGDAIADDWKKLSNYKDAKKALDDYKKTFNKLTTILEGQFDLTAFEVSETMSDGKYANQLMDENAVLNESVGPIREAEEFSKRRLLMARENWRDLAKRQDEIKTLKAGVKECVSYARDLLRQAKEAEESGNHYKAESLCEEAQVRMRFADELVNKSKEIAGDMLSYQMDNTSQASLDITKINIEMNNAARNLKKITSEFNASDLLIASAFEGKLPLSTRATQMLVQVLRKAEDLGMEIPNFDLLVRNPQQIGPFLQQIAKASNQPDLIREIETWVGEPERITAFITPSQAVGFYGGTQVEGGLRSGGNAPLETDLGLEGTDYYQNMLQFLSHPIFSRQVNQMWTGGHAALTSDDMRWMQQMMSALKSGNMDRIMSGAARGVDLGVYTRMNRNLGFDSASNRKYNNAVTETTQTYFSRRANGASTPSSR